MSILKNSPFVVDEIYCKSNFDSIHNVDVDYINTRQNEDFQDEHVSLNLIIAEKNKQILEKDIKINELNNFLDNFTTIIKNYRKQERRWNKDMK